MNSSLNLSLIQEERPQVQLQTGFTGEAACIIEPATGAELGSYQNASSADVDAVIERAAAAQAGWAATDFETRAAVLRKFAALLEQNTDAINGWNTRECGSIVPKAQWELKASVDQAHMCSAMPMNATGEIFPSGMPGRENYWIRVPVGVVGVISPWNFPLLLSLRSVLPALAMGNSVIVKPDPHSVVTGGIVITQLLKEAGLPDDVCQLVLGGADQGRQLVEHPQVNMIAFTGSTAVGREISVACARALKKSSLELGGNNALVVFEDADIAGASSCAAWGAFLHQGQICMQAGRHIVHKDVAEAYVNALVERASRLPAGDPFRDQCALGPIINSRQADRVMRLIEESVAMGAKVVCGGERKGNCINPTVMTDVTPEMPIFREEIFGPVAPIVTFSSEEEAIALANDTEYGLSAAIHCGDSGRGRRLARQIQAGMVHVNDQTVNNEFHVPFGGMKASGNAGRFGGPANLDEFSERQWISVMDAPIQYPF